MLRKIILFSIGILIVITTITLFYKNSTSDNTKVYLPELKVKDFLGKEINTKSLQHFKGYCVVLFNSECDICDAEAEILSLAKDLYKDNCFIFYSPEPDSIINLFIVKHKLKGNNVFIISALFDSIIQQFDGKSAPYVFIYNENKELVYHKSTAQLITFKKYWSRNK